MMHKESQCSPQFAWRYEGCSDFFWTPSWRILLFCQGWPRFDFHSLCYVTICGNMSCTSAKHSEVVGKTLLLFFWCKFPIFAQLVSQGVQWAWGSGWSGTRGLEVMKICRTCCLSCYCCCCCCWCCWKSQTSQTMKTCPCHLTCPCHQTCHCPLVIGLAFIGPIRLVIGLAYTTSWLLSLLFPMSGIDGVCESLHFVEGARFPLLAHNVFDLFS